MGEIDDILIHKCKIGNRAAQKQLYYLSKDRLKFIALRYCRVIQDAQDVVQNTYLKIFKSINKFDSKKGSFDNWSSKILVNEAYMILRKSRQVSLLPLEDKNLMPNRFQQPNLDKLTIEEIRKTLSYLTDDYRIVINMYFFEQFNYKEMSLLLNIKESSVRSKVTRAKSELNIIWSKLNSMHYELKKIK